jgi:tetratricopeptide (TPR) repeat protein
LKYKILVLISALIILVTALSEFTVLAAPYQGYTYTYWGTTRSSPIAYMPDRIIDGKNLGIDNFNAPSDLFVAKDGNVYVLDAGNGRIVIFDEQWKVIRQIIGFQKEGKQDQFANPQGIFVTDKGQIYVADTENKRIVELTNEGTFVREIGAPQSEVIRTGFEYLPIKLAVDKAGRIYVVGKGVFDGIIEFDLDGHFTGFMGTNRVKFDAWDYFWKSISSKSQKSKLVQFVPQEFNNLDLDEEGFLYTTTTELNSSDPIKKLNSTGIDVLRREGYFAPRGDLFSEQGSALTDITIRDHGVYSVLDSKHGRVFTYNEDGILMYIFGQLGQQEGTFVNPVAIAHIGNNLLVLDSGMNRINVFAPTRFGALTNEANAQYSTGKHDEAATMWQQLLKLDSNNETAYVGIGKALLRQGDYKQAMEYLELGYDREYYSKAFGKYRKNLLRGYFGTFMTSIVILFGAYLVWIAVRRRLKKRVGANVSSNG